MTEQQPTKLEINGEYRGLHFRITNSDNGSYFNVWEYTPIFGKQADIAFGSACDRNKYTYEYVISVIDKMLQDIEQKV